VTANLWHFWFGWVQCLRGFAWVLWSVSCTLARRYFRNGSLRLNVHACSLRCENGGVIGRKSGENGEY